MNQLVRYFLERRDCFKEIHFVLKKYVLRKAFFLENGLQARLYGDIVNISPSHPPASGVSRGSLKKRKK